MFGWLLFYKDAAPDGAGSCTLRCTFDGKLHQERNPCRAGVEETQRPGRGGIFLVLLTFDRPFRGVVESASIALGRRTEFFAATVLLGVLKSDIWEPYIYTQTERAAEFRTLIVPKGLVRIAQRFNAGSTAQRDPSRRDG